MINCTQGVARRGGSGRIEFVLVFTSSPDCLARIFCSADPSRSCAVSYGGAVLGGDREPEWRGAGVAWAFGEGRPTESRNMCTREYLLTNCPLQLALCDGDEAKTSAPTASFGYLTPGISYIFTFFLVNDVRPLQPGPGLQQDRERVRCGLEFQFSFFAQSVSRCGNASLDPRAASYGRSESDQQFDGAPGVAC